MRKSALYVLGLVVTVIVALGLVVLSSASEANGVRLHKYAYYFMERQFIYLGIGLVVATACAMFDYHKWRDCPWLTFAFYLIVIAGLAYVFNFKEINGSHRWFQLGPVRVQPSEIAKLATVLVTAVWLDRVSWRVEEFKSGVLWPAALIGGIVLPVLLEPDFGSVMVIGLVGVLVMVVAGVRILHLLPLFLCGMAGVAVLILNNANRMARIKAFLGMHGDGGAVVLSAAAKRAAHQVTQSLVAIGNGGIWGVGLGDSIQKQYYLPEAHTDFIFAIGAEEFGLPFSVGVLVLFLTFFALCVYIAAKATDRLGRLLVVGMTFIIFFQAMFNLGVVSGALPTKGMALPFFSYGGTNLVSAFFAVGTIFSVGIRSYRERTHGYMRKVVMR